MSKTQSKPSKSLKKDPLLQSILLEFAKHIGLAKVIVWWVIVRSLLAKKKNKVLDGYKPDKSDVFVATYYKSGTNWMLQIGQQIADLGDSKFSHIHDVVPWPEVGLSSDLNDKSGVKSPTGLRVIKTHLNSDYVPYDSEAKYLVVIRDPKEVLISSYHFFCGILNVLPNVDINGWFDVFSAQGSLLENWIEHTAGFWAWRDRPNVYVIGYEELKNNPVIEIKKIVQLLGVELDENQLEQVLERASFKYMKAHGEQFAPPRSPFLRDEQTTKMMRRGETGIKEEESNDAILALIDQRCQQKLKDKGSDFPYAAMFNIVQASSKK
jgi:hypothetical protein